jgi:hypothetical protein
MNIKENTVFSSPCSFRSLSLVCVGGFVFWFAVVVVVVVVVVVIDDDDDDARLAAGLWLAGGEAS